MPTPNPAVLKVLLPAYEPCPGFGSTCREMRWEPGTGHVPRGFSGAIGHLDEVSLVLVTAEPGDPFTHERYPISPPPAVLKAASEYVYAVRETATDIYHQNLRYILDGCFPSLTFHEQMRKTWVTEAVLCSAATEGGKVSRACERECRSRFLEPQLRLFPKALVVALGRKAQSRLRDWHGVIGAYAIAPPGANFKRARPSWDAVITEYRSRNG